MVAELRGELCMRFAENITVAQKSQANTQNQKKKEQTENAEPSPSDIFFRNNRVRERITRCFSNTPFLHLQDLPALLCIS